MLKEISYDEVHRLFDYDEKTGVFINKTTRCGRALKGSVAGCLNGRGYLEIRVNGKAYRAHRLAWLYCYGYFSEHQIDHINRIKTDNRIENLREATKSCNAKNSKIQNNNTSGIKGVYWNKLNNKWQVAIKDKNHKEIYIGRFASKLEAAKARYAAEVEHGYPDCQTQSSALAYIATGGGR